MRRGKPLKRTGEPKRRTPLKPKSDKRIAEDAPGGPREQVRQVTFKKDGYRCVAADIAPDVPCIAGSLECDEIQGRGREPGSHLDENATQTLCRICHLLKTDKPWVAAMLGLYGGVEWLERIAVLPADRSAERALREAIDEWTRLKATALGRPLPANRQPTAGAIALIRSRIDHAVTTSGYGDAVGPVPPGW